MEIFDFEELRFSKVVLPARLWRVLHDRSKQMLVVVCRNAMPERPKLLLMNQIDTESVCFDFPTELPNWAEVMAADNGQLFLHQFAGNKDPSLEGAWLWDWAGSKAPHFFKNKTFDSFDSDAYNVGNSANMERVNTLSKAQQKGQFLSFHSPEYYGKDSPYFDSISQIINKNLAEVDLNTLSFGYFESDAGLLLGWRTGDDFVHFATHQLGQANRKMNYQSFQVEKNVSSSFWFAITNLGICFASGPQNLIFAHR